MGKWGTESWDVPSGQGAALILLCGMFLAGGIAGCLYAGFAGSAGAEELRDYLADYLTLMGNGSGARAFWPLLWEHLRWLLAVVVLGFTALGAVGLPALFCVRGFLFSFSVGCFCRVFGGVGLLPAMALFGLPALLWAPALFLAGSQSYSWVRRLPQRGSGESRRWPSFGPSYWMRVGLCALLTLLCGGMGYLVVPVLLRAAARIVL